MRTKSLKKNKINVITLGCSKNIYDSEVLKNITPEWQKASRVLFNTLHRMKIKTGDVFLMWRMKQLIAEGRIEVIGDMNKGWKEFDVRKPGQQTEAVSEESAETGEH